MNEHAHRILEARIEESENLLWADQPIQGIQFTLSDIFMIPFTVIWCGFAIVWEILAFIGEAPFFFLIFGGIFVVIGLYMVFGRFLYSSYQRKNTFYGITQERILILKSSSLTSHELASLPQTTLSEGKNSNGTITFGNPPFYQKWFADLGWLGANTSQDLDQISNVQEVYKLIRDTKKGLTNDA